MTPKKNSCPECDSRNDADAVYCKRCGIRLGFDCPKCDKINERDAAFCIRCGAYMSASPIGQPESDDGPTVRDYDAAPTIARARRSASAARGRRVPEAKSPPRRTVPTVRREKGSIVPWLIGTAIISGAIGFAIESSGRGPGLHVGAATIGASMGSALLGALVCLFTHRAMLGSGGARLGCLGAVLAFAAMVVFVTQAYASLVVLFLAFGAGIGAAIRTSLLN